MTLTATAVDTATTPRFSGRERAILLVLLGAGFMLSVDFSILNVALPMAGAGVGLGTEALPWITTAFALPAAGFTLLFGRLSDVYGRRRFFLSAMVLLTVASLLGGFATNPEALLIARVLQGFATAIAIPTGLALLTTSFPEGPRRERVLGLNGALLSGGFTVGALVGGALVSALGWRAAFFINVPVAVAILAAAPVLLAESKASTRAKLDVAGAISVTGGLLAVVYGVVETNLLAGLVGALLLGVFWMIEVRSPAPLVPVSILRRPTVKWGNYAGLVIFSMEPAMIFLTTLYLQKVLELSPLQTGLVFGVPGLASVAAGVMAGRFIGRWGSTAVLVVGMSVQALATVPLLFLGPDRTALAVLLPALFIGFFGHVAAIVSFMVTGTSGLPDDEQGLATGLTSMTQQIGITIGIPVLSAVAALHSGQMGGIRLALVVNVVVTLASVVLVGRGLRRKGRPMRQDRRDPSTAARR